jgi:hypothetical protein
MIDVIYYCRYHFASDFGSQNETAGHEARPDAEARVFWVGPAEIPAGVRAALASAAVV